MLSGTKGNGSGKKPDSEVGKASAALGHNRSPPLVGPPPLVDPEELIPSDEAAKLLHQKPQTLAAWRSQGRGPEFYKIGRSVFYTRGGLRAHVAASIVVPRQGAA